MSVSMPRKVRVLVVDDSPTVRRILTECLSAEPDIEVVGTAPDPYVARNLILSLKPDVLTLDIEMPRMDGLTFLRKLMRHHPMPVLVVSSLAQSSCAAAMSALAEGAVDVLPKPSDPGAIADLRQALAAKVRAAAIARVNASGRGGASACPTASPRLRLSAVVAIGASTGGTEAIRQLLAEFPAGSPAVLIVQHIPAGFSKAFSDRLAAVCRMEVREAADGDEIRPGLALLSPGNQHMLVRRAGAGYRVALNSGPRVCYQRPSVDVLFSSVAGAMRDAAGVILTGMGSDGAAGLLRMKQSGAATIAQDEASSAVFGMPREAIRVGAADQVLPLTEIPRALFRLLAVSGNGINENSGLDRR